MTTIRARLRLTCSWLVLLAAALALMLLAGCTLAATESATRAPTAGPAAATATPSPTAPPPTPTATPSPEPPADFDGRRAFGYLEDQMAFGPRWPGSPGHRQVGEYIVDQLEAAGWLAAEQTFDYQGVQGRNIIGRANAGRGPVIILGAHYDTRRIADQTPGATEPVPGAVDGASGVAVLLELAQTLDLDAVDREIWLAFFDVEDQGRGGMPGFDWIVGSSYMAQNLTVTPEAMVLVDMIGDADQQLYYEANSNLELRAELWAIAADLGYGASFIPEVRHSMIDDHIPFLMAGIPAVDIIDFDYPYWHTIEDTADKASAASLESVGRTLEWWLEEELGGQP